MKQAHLGPADCLKKGLSGAKGLTKARKNNTKNLYTVILYGVSKRDDLTVWVMEKVKTTTKGKRSYRCWMASWREGGKTRNVHLGSARKMDGEAARQKARERKAEALGMQGS